MILTLIKFLIELIDHSNKKKNNLFFLKKNFQNKKLKIIDIGAHEVNYRIILEKFSNRKNICF